MIKKGLHNFYHVTSTENLMKIIASGGIDPAFAKGRRKFSWYVKFEHVAWAVAHCTRKHGISLAKTMVLKVNVDQAIMRPFPPHPMFYTNEIVVPLDYLDAATFLMREEARLLKFWQQVDEGDWYEHLREKE